MDPDLMDDLCVCPVCLDQPVDACARCGGEGMPALGMVLCRDLRLGEARVTVAEVRAGIIVEVAS